MADESTSMSLLNRVQSQQRDAWFRLVYLYGPLVDRWCRGWGVPTTDVEDIRQEVFLSVSSGLATFRRDRPGDTFRGWLRVIAHRKFLDFCRRRQRQPIGQGGTDVQQRLLQTPETESSLADDDSPEEIKGLQRRGLELIRGEFEERSWQAFWRTAVEGQAPADVASDMEMTPAAVRKAKSRVLRRLKEELGEVLE